MARSFDLDPTLWHFRGPVQHLAEKWRPDDATFPQLQERVAWLLERIKYRRQSLWREPLHPAALYPRSSAPHLLRSVWLCRIGLKLESTSLDLSAACFHFLHGFRRGYTFNENNIVTAFFHGAEFSVILARFVACLHISDGGIQNRTEIPHSICENRVRIARCVIEQRAYRLDATFFCGIRSANTLTQ